MVLRVGAQIAHDIHAHAFVQRLLHVFRQRDAFHREAFQCQAQSGKCRLQFFHHRLRQQHLVGRHVQKRNVRCAERRRHLRHHRVAQLRFQFIARIAFHHAGHFFEKHIGLGDAVGIHAERAQLYHAEIRIAHGYRLRRAPAFAQLLARIEEIHVRFEGRLEEFVPVAQVGQHRQRLRVQGVAAGKEYVGHHAFVNKNRGLAFAHGQARTVLDFLVGNRETPHQRVFIRVFPLDDINKLLADKVQHVDFLFECCQCGGLTIDQAGGVEYAHRDCPKPQKQAHGDIVRFQFFGQAG